ncbi:MAG: cysteine--tRNA ligase [Bacilli bacterium]|jgi:cysteinyl-tRNA synthetase|nr:cysteine--tRNA ligase [Bacilli bacterium]
MKLYNTETRKIEEFIPWQENKVGMYTCGPTVYSYAHIGNLRTYIMEDILEKTLRLLGYDVKRVMNITDVGHLSSDADTGEDKMVKSAKKENKSVLDIAKFYTEEFFKDTDKLNIKKPDIVSPATENIEEYIKIISKLLNDGYAYSAGGNIYFDTSKLDNYYRLTNHVGEELISGVRDTVEEDENKKNKTDFVLWFTKSKFEDQELKWESPFGKGYPGWHIECTGISLRNIGEYLDIHCGGVDNIFPHHTNEIAQSEAFIGHKWCKYWVHGEHLNDSTGKMSKSKGKVLTVSTLEEEGYNPLSYRFMVLQSHYRKQLAFSYENLSGAENAYKKLKRQVLNLKDNEEINNDIKEEYLNKFKECLSDDLNTANCLTLIYEVLKSDTSDTTKKEIIREFDKVLSLDLTKEEKTTIDENYIKEMIAKRNEAKKNKDFTLADAIRSDLEKEGIILKDTREGTAYEVK